MHWLAAVAEGVPEQRASSTGSRALREQEAEFYEAVIALLASMPTGTTVLEALETETGQRIRRKWSLKHGRQPPL